MGILLSGNEAIARGAFEAGVEAAFAYPGTPSTEILETIAREYDEIYAEWTSNEKVALETAIGSSLYGKRTIVSMKHVGLNVAADPLFSLSYMGVNGGIVIVSADEPSMFSSQNEQDNRWYGLFAKIPVLEPSDSEEARIFTIEAFDISERFDTPVLLRITTRIAHSKSVVNPGTRKMPEGFSGYEKNFHKNVLMPMNARVRHRIVEERMSRLEEYSNNFRYNVLIEGKGRKVITSGIDYQYTREVFPEASILKLSMTNPLPRRKIDEFIGNRESNEKILVIESLDPFIEMQIKSWGYTTVEGKERTGKLYELSVSRLREIFLADKDEHLNEEASAVENLPPRPPVLCSGCPHRGVYYELRKKKAIVHGDIGCYTLGALPPLSAMDTCVDMGASVSMANGMNAMIKRNGEEKRPVFATIGDSTFVHSGITPLIDAVTNRIPTHVIILDNRVTAMTGHQVNPVTGISIKGEDAPQLDLEKLCRAVGVKTVEVIDPFSLDEIESAVERHKKLDEASVIIARAPCALIPLAEKKAPYRIETDKCTMCKICLKTGCPSISIVDGKMVIDEETCTGCSICFQVCKFEAILQVEGAGI